MHYIQLRTAALAAGGVPRWELCCIEWRISFVPLPELNLEGNLLHRLPQELGSLLHLRTINLARNKFRHFPQPLAAAPALESINLEGNEIAGEREGAGAEKWWM